MERTQLKTELLAIRANKFVCDRRTRTIHDCSCKTIDEIPDDAFAVMRALPAEEYGFKIAPCCYRRVMIRTGIADYSPLASMDDMLELFDHFGATDEQLKVLFCDLKSIFLYQSKTKCILHVKDDSWQIEKPPNGGLQLLHNNYRVNKIGYNRQFNRGYGAFHEQHFRRGKTPQFDDIFREITEYSWEKHIKYLKAKRENR